MTQTATLNRQARRLNERKAKKAAGTPTQPGDFSQELNDVNKSLPDMQANLPNIDSLSLNMLQSMNTSGLNSLNQPGNLDPKRHIGSTDSPPLDIEPKERTPKFKKLKKGLMDLMSTLALPLLALSPQDALVIMQHADSYSDRWTDLAEKDERVYKALNSLLEGEVYTALILETGAIAYAVLKNHGIDVLAWFVNLFSRKEQPTPAAKHDPVTQPPQAQSRDDIAANRLFQTV